MTNKAKNLVFFYYLLDLILLSVSFFIMKLIKYEDRPPEYILSIYFMLMITWIIILIANDSEKLYLRESFLVRLRLQIINFLVFVGLVAVIIFSFHLGYFSRLQTFGTIAIFFILKTTVFYGIYFWVWQRRKKGRHLAKVLVAGAGRVGCKFYEFTQKNQYLGFKVVGFLDDYIQDKSCDIQSMILGRVEDIPDVLDKYEVDEVVIAIPLTAESLINTIINVSDFHGKRIKLIPDFYRILNRKHQVSSIGDIPVINVREIPLDHILNSLLKRIFDILLSLIAIVAGLPVMIILAVLIKLNSKGPLFYRPARLSKGGEQFRMLKFRSMYVGDCADDANKSAEVNDPRITRIGKFMRKYNLDELPQFFNVLINNMSVVGPRPHRILLNYDMQHAVSGYMIRHYIKPGITGWAQVNGWRGPTTTEEQKKQRTKHDLWYIENWSFWLDIKIIFLTIFSRKARENAF